MKPFGKQQMTGIENLNFGAHSELLDLRRHFLQHARRVGHDVVLLAEVHRAAVERADFGQQLCNMRQPFGGADHIGADLGRRQRPLGAAQRQVAAHAGSEVDDDIDARPLDEVHDLLIERHVARALAGFGIAHMDMGNRCAGIGRFDRRIGDLARRDRHLVGAAGRVAGPSNCACDENVATGLETHGENLPESDRRIMTRLQDSALRFTKFELMQSEKPTIFQAERSSLKVTLLVFSGSSIMCVASTVDPLRAANRVSGEVVFDWKIVSVGGDPPVTTSGLPVAVSGRFDPAEATDVLILVGGFGTRDQASRELLAGVRRVAKAARACGGVEAGNLAARAGGSARRPEGDDALGGHGGLRGRLSGSGCAAGPICHRRTGLHIGRGIADLRPHAAHHPHAAWHGGCARCGQRLHLRPGKGRDGRAAPGLARTARRLRSTAGAGDPPYGSAYRRTAHHRCDRTTDRHHSPRAGDDLSQVDRRDARRLLSAPAPQRRQTPRSRHTRSDGRHRSPYRVFVGGGLLAAPSRTHSAQLRCG